MLPLAMPGGLFLLLFAPLLLPSVALVTRDIPFFHLPLRHAFREILLSGSLPFWNPWISGGQPILSNPNYAAFYPLTWLVLPLSPTYAINLLAIGHALWAFLGCFSLCRALGTSRRAAAMGAVGFAAGGAFLSLLHAFNFLCGMAWFPWVLRWALPFLRGQESVVRSLLATSAGLAIMLLAGEPVAVLITGLMLACLAANGSAPWGRRLAHLAAVATLAALFAAVQLVPTWSRLQEGPRGSRMDAEVATAWSAPPERLVELVLPRFFGEANRDEENLYFGWGVHDRNFPYVIHLSPGLLLALLAAAAFLRWPIPFRWGWALSAAAGVFLGLGRHNPAYGWLLERVGIFSLIRYPEKFLLLTFASLAVAGALAWQQLEDSTRSGEKQRIHFPVALSSVAAAIAGVFLVLLWVVPEVGKWYIVNHSGLRPSPGDLERGLAFLRTEAAISCALAIAIAALLLGLKRAPGAARAISLLALLLLSFDLWHHHRGLVASLSADGLTAPPEILGDLGEHEGRLFTNVPFSKEPEVNLRIGEPGFYQVLGRRARLDPYSAILWGESYALNRDYDYMMTYWAQVAFQTVKEEWERPDAILRILGAWGVGTILIRRSPAELLAELKEKGGEPLPARADVNPFRLPEHRFVERLSVHRSVEAALTALRREVFDLRRSEHLVAPEIFTGSKPLICESAREPSLVLSRPGRVELRYESPGTACLIVATTFDRGWEASVDGEPVAAHPTALGQIALILPGGQHLVSLRYRDPWVKVGLAVTALTVLVLLLVAVEARRRAVSTD